MLWVQGDPEQIVSTHDVIKAAVAFWDLDAQVKAMEELQANNNWKRAWGLYYVGNAMASGGNPRPPLSAYPPLPEGPPIPPFIRATEMTPPMEETLEEEIPNVSGPGVGSATTSNDDDEDDEDEDGNEVKLVMVKLLQVVKANQTNLS